MRLQAKSPVSPVLWFAVLGAPSAWVLQFGVGYWLSQAKCSAAGEMWGISLDAWIIVLSVVTIPMAVGSGLVAFGLFRGAAEDESAAPPGGRNRFLAAIGMAVTPIFVFIMALNLIGVLTYSSCPAG